MMLRGFFVYRSVWNLMQVGSEVREISCAWWTGFQMKIHFNFEVWSKENSTGAASVIGLQTRAETGDFGGEFVCNLCAFSGNRELHTKSVLNN